ncbi:MAG: glycosyltransferase [Ignavibacteriae bacterium]|nr:glycosyltransferase [Ignavibacteriota bacterium]
MKPRISIIIPTLSEERVLEKTLSQFTPQLRERFQLEIIVSDGGSTDRTLEIAHQNADKVIDSNEVTPQTIAMGRNLGATISEGDILMFIDADVMIENIEHFFQTLHQTLEKRNAIAVTCNVRVYHQEETLVDKVFHQFYNKYFYLLNIIGIGMGRGECQIIKKIYFERVGGFNEQMVAGEDFDIFTRLKKFGNVIFEHALTVRESPRRYRKFGYLYISGLWFLNAMSVMIFRKSAVTQWKVVR